jgi:hypothetical protein
MFGMKRKRGQFTIESHRLAKQRMVVDDVRRASHSEFDIVKEGRSVDEPATQTLDDERKRGVTGKRAFAAGLSDDDSRLGPDALKPGVEIVKQEAQKSQYRRDCILQIFAPQSALT